MRKVSTLLSHVHGAALFKLTYTSLLLNFPSFSVSPSFVGWLCFDVHRKSPRKRSAFDRTADISPSKKTRTAPSTLDWTERFSGLWKVQPADFAIEQTFNQLMSLNRSQCCICSLFETPSPFSNYKPANLQLALQTRMESASKPPSVKSLKVMSVAVQLLKTWHTVFVHPGVSELCVLYIAP